MINQQPGKYSLSTDDIIALKTAGVSDKVIAAINDSQATVEEKEKARSAVQSILSSPLLTKIFGWVTGSPD